MAQVEIWVPMLGDGTLQNPFRPDVPADLKWTADESAPTDFSTGRPAVTHFNLIVDEADIPKCAKRILDKDVPEHDRLLVGLVRHCRHDVDGKADEFLDAIPCATVERKAMVKRLLVHATHRGLAPDKSAALVVSRGLPSAARTEGIDSEVHAAAVAFAARELGLPIAEAAVRLTTYLERQRGMA